MQELTPNLYIGTTSETETIPPNIDTIVNLTWNDVPNETDTIPLMNDNMNTQTEIRKAVQIVSDYIEEETTTLVVSETGKSRAVIISAIALADKHQTELDTAIAMIEKDYPRADPHESLKQHGLNYLKKKR